MFAFALWNVVLQTDSAGLVADAVDDEPIVIEVIPLRCGGKVAAGRKVEDLALLVSDEGIGV